MNHYKCCTALIGRLLTLGVSCAAVLAFTASAHAQTVYLDANGTTAGLGDPGTSSYNWAATSAAPADQIWTSDATGVAAPSDYATASGGATVPLVLDLRNEAGYFNGPSLNLQNDFTVSSFTILTNDQPFTYLNGGGHTLTSASYNVGGGVTYLSNLTLGGGDFTLSGGGQFVLTGGVSYSGVAHVLAGGFLYNVTGGNTNEDVILDAGARLHTRGINMGNLTGAAGSFFSTDTAGTPFAVTSTINTTFAGNMNPGGGSFTKNGAATLTLSGANTSIAATTINAGTLVAANNDAFSTSSTGVEVKSGAALQVNNGIVLNSASNVALDAGSTFVVGTTGATGTAELAGNLTALAGTTLKFDLNGTSPIDFLTVDGKLTLNGHVTFDFASLGGNSFVRGQLYEIIAGGTSPSDFTGFTSTVNGPFGPYVNDQGVISLQGNNVYVEFGAVPEPSTWAFLSIGLALVAVMRLRVRASRVA